MKGWRQAGRNAGGERQRVAIAVPRSSIRRCCWLTSRLKSRFTGDEVLSLLEGLHCEFDTTILMVT